MAPEATLPRGDVNVPSDYFSLAGFEVIMHGRFWVLTEEDSELAITLGLGKPVIVYVPYGDNAQDREAYDKRARVFADVHPLSLQVDQTTGNTNGIILVRDANQCADVLYALAKSQLNVKVSRENEADPLSGETSIFWVLSEAITGNESVIRVATGWKHLRTAFWSAFRPDLHIP
jgi:hypothetical protein